MWSCSLEEATHMAWSAMGLCGESPNPVPSLGKGVACLCVPATQGR